MGQRARSLFVAAVQRWRSLASAGGAGGGNSKPPQQPADVPFKYVQAAVATSAQGPPLEGGDEPAARGEITPLSPHGNALSNGRTMPNRLPPQSSHPAVERTLHILRRLAVQADRTLHGFRQRPEGSEQQTQQRDDADAFPAIDHRTRGEEVRLVRDVFLRSRTPAPQVVVFSGAERANGCTWICARAAETLAALGHGTVCLVDANFRSPSLHRYFNIDNEKGLAETLETTDPLLRYVQYLPQSNLWVLTSGLVSSDPDTLLISSRLKDCITELRAYFKCVLIDTPPLSLYLDACHLGRAADGIVVVVEANSTQRENARSVKERLEVAGVPILAAVLNKQTNPVPELIRRYL